MTDRSSQIFDANLITRRRQELHYDRIRQGRGCGQSAQEGGPCWCRKAGTNDAQGQPQDLPCPAKDNFGEYPVDLSKVPLW